MGKITFTDQQKADAIDEHRMAAEVLAETVLRESLALYKMQCILGDNKADEMEALHKLKAQDVTDRLVREEFGSFSDWE